MFDILLILPLLIFIGRVQINGWQERHPHLPPNFLYVLFAWHFAMSLIYIAYAYSTRSDSFEYYELSQAAENWTDLWGTGTPFMRFLAYPFTNLLGLSYLSTMLVFAYAGFWASGLLYLSVKEQLGPMPTIGTRYTWAEWIFLLPNIHFWSGSLGKGAVIFLGVAVFIYGLSRFNRRPVHILAGLILSFLIRPHIALILVAGTAIGVLITSRGISWYIRLFIGAAAGFASLYFFRETVEFTQVSQDNMEAFLTRRSMELSKAGSGVDMASYNLPMKLFTFWFRPLFVDAPGIMGLIVSFENAFYLWMLYQILVIGIRSFGAWNGWFKAGMFIFILGGIALSQVSGNLGIAMRQKAQLMPLFFFLFLKVKEWEYKKERQLALDL